MTDPAFRLVKPTLKTPFHIDYLWWERQQRELRVYLHSHLCDEHRAKFEAVEDAGEVDWVDADTAEVQRVDGVQHALRIHCSLQPSYLEAHTSLVDAVFRVFLANGNTPLTPFELAERIGRPGQETTVLRTLSGARVYKGLRPIPEGAH
ncbi:MAG: hypothetical protein HY872_01665 [Chloroflexi bacterium]|nr:hypothetical protein [Chloroflexota bacterium]